MDSERLKREEVIKQQESKPRSANKEYRGIVPWGNENRHKEINDVQEILSLSTKGPSEGSTESVRMRHKDIGQLM